MFARLYCRQSRALGIKDALTCRAIECIRRRVEVQMWRSWRQKSTNISLNVMELNQTSRKVRSLTQRDSIRKKKQCWFQSVFWAMHTANFYFHLSDSSILAAWGLEFCSLSLFLHITWYGTIRLQLQAKRSPLHDSHSRWQRLRLTTQRPYTKNSAIQPLRRLPPINVQLTSQLSFPFAFHKWGLRWYPGIEAQFLWLAQTSYGGSYPCRGARSKGDIWVS